MDVKSWETWVDEIAAAVRGVPDSALAEAAEALSISSLVITAGNGGSHALASHAAQALMKPSYAPGGGTSAVCLSDMVPTLTAHANDGAWGAALVELARPFLELRHVKTALWIFSSSGRSQNIVELAREARRIDPEGALVAFTGFDGEPLRSLATVSVHVASHDYEVVEPAHDALLHRVQFHLRALTGR